ncbi:chloride channel protein CLC-c-like isoform X2 [Rutidosis leptorrhynchoides]|uniref:chloride channel protein CLC-c-like isoform X2 n=1 Tax=Rutidosis leptorrhynchoides TaxID=125765 RepID=UPI003A99D292
MNSIWNVFKKDFAEVGLSKGQKLKALDIMAKEMDICPALHLITNTSSYSNVESMTLAKVVVAFGKPELSHSCVLCSTKDSQKARIAVTACILLGVSVANTNSLGLISLGDPELKGSVGPLYALPEVGTTFAH